ncbi:molybdopterin-guanine dinucleotide biosynthesis protein MobA [Aquisphaera giovannonii]|uniref:Molybdopterin-guanine dinucleotide biosynthesis protein MobA n=1 Tax=Aquisphaera giovannonii TaxID=406548 RepID=A0A5B9VZC3_9BACT|nr:NTP transferase domain-containing protein [Aquisphaera giovannonii]QEH33638.1 molybdopterin-guanine dinucleotide biosynthesis protein MobA [Aquisphaera giovannonii]
MTPRRLDAIVPAAGESCRLGRPKLLLPFDGLPLIARVVTALRDGGNDRVVVVSPPMDSPEGPALAEAARAAGAVVIAPAERPREMRGSVQAGIEWLSRSGPPAAAMLTPGDSPGLTAHVVRQVRDRWEESPRSIAVGVAGGRRVHPTILPWDILEEVPLLPEGQGVNAALRVHEARLVSVPLDCPELAEDLDTPDDLDAWRTRLGERPPNSMTVTVRLFAVARQRSGRPEIAIEVPRDATVGLLRDAIARQHPELSEIAARVAIAVDDEYASDGHPISAGSRVAIIPPVSGGECP